MKLYRYPVTYQGAQSCCAFSVLAVNRLNAVRMALVLCPVTVTLPEHLQTLGQVAKANVFTIGQGTFARNA